MLRPVLPTQHRSYGSVPSQAQQRAAQQPRSDQGLTLMECLVAIIMVALVAGSIAPMLVISVASRLNNQKAEQALGLAQQEIDRTRTLVERGEFEDEDGNTTLPPVASGVDATNQDISDAAAPNLSVTDTANFAYARRVDLDNDSQPDFLVQRFRAAGYTPPSATHPAAFTMGVRVYDIRASETPSLLTEAASLGLTGSEGQRSRRPLAVLYTTIAVGDQAESLCDLIRYINSQQDTPASSSNLALPSTCPPASP